MSEIPMRTMLLLVLTLAFFTLLALFGIHPVNVIEIENATETEMQQFAEKLVYATHLLALMTVLICSFIIVYEIKKRCSNRKSEVA
jgi:hypothetical protein